MAFAEQKGCGLHTQFVGYQERRIFGFGDFLSTLQDTLLINVKRVFVEVGHATEKLKCSLRDITRKINP